MGRNSSVGMATCYRLDDPGGTRGLGRRSLDSHLLGLRVRIPPGAWMFVLCVLYSKDKKAKVRTAHTKKQIRIKYNERTRE